MNRQKKYILEKWFCEYIKPSAFSFSKKEKHTIINSVKHYHYDDIAEDFKYMSKYIKRRANE